MQFPVLSNSNSPYSISVEHHYKRKTFFFNEINNILRINTKTIICQLKIIYVESISNTLCLRWWFVQNKCLKRQYQMPLSPFNFQFLIQFTLIFIFFSNVCVFVRRRDSATRFGAAWRSRTLHASIYGLRLVSTTGTLLTACRLINIKLQAIFVVCIIEHF